MTVQNWRIDLLAHGERMLAAATERTGDSNAAHLIVHEVMTSAMSRAEGPLSQDDLNADLDDALRALDR